MLSDLVLMVSTQVLGLFRSTASMYSVLNILSDVWCCCATLLFVATLFLVHFPESFYYFLLIPLLISFV